MKLKRDKQQSKKKYSITIFEFAIFLAITTYLAAIFIILRPTFYTSLAPTVSPVYCAVDENTKIESFLKECNYSGSASFDTQNIRTSCKMTPNKAFLIPSEKECYKVSDVLALNNTIHLSDTISLLALLLSIFTIIIPILSFFSLKEEKRRFHIEIEQKTKEEQEKAKKDINIYLKNDFRHFERNFEKNVDKKLINLICFGEIIPHIERFKVHFQLYYKQRFYEVAIENKNTDPLIMIEIINKSAEIDIEAADIAQRLLQLIEGSKTDAFQTLENYHVKFSSATTQDADYIKVLKTILSLMYHKYCLFGSDQNKQALAKFLTILKIKIADLPQPPEPKN